jgi:hypothetical protein
MAYKIDGVKSALAEFDFAALKAFGEARVPETPTSFAEQIRRSQQQISNRQAPVTPLVQQSAFLPRQYPSFDKTQSRFRLFDARITMETSILTLPLDRANALSNVAMGALVIGVMLSIAATIALIWLSGIKSRYANEHLSQMFTQSEQAKAEAAKANERAAEFLLRAQQANVEQEKARLQLEHVRSLSAWRRVSAEQHEKIINTLRGHAMTINLLSPGNDPEADQFASDIAETLKEAGVSVNASASMLPIPIRGLGMSMSSSESAKTLYLAFRGAGFEVKDLPEKDPVMIVVGMKPPAF